MSHGNVGEREGDTLGEVVGQDVVGAQKKNYSEDNWWLHNSASANIEKVFFFVFVFSYSTKRSQTKNK